MIPGTLKLHSTEPNRELGFTGTAGDATLSISLLAYQNRYAALNGLFGHKRPELVGGIFHTPIMLRPNDVTDTDFVTGKYGFQAVASPIHNVNKTCPGRWRTYSPHGVRPHISLAPTGIPLTTCLLLWGIDTTKPELIEKSQQLACRRYG
jgi:hypothetical protein